MLSTYDEEFRNGPRQAVASNSVYAFRLADQEGERLRAHQRCTVFEVLSEQNELDLVQSELSG